MDLAIAIARFIGAWLLVIGPLNQAALDLADEQINRQALLAAKGRVDHPTPVPAREWLVPPLAIAHHLRRRRQYRASAIAQLAPEEALAWRGYSGKATAWLTVAGGGLLIAVGETWELVKGLHRASVVFWIVLLATLALIVATTALRQRRAR